MPTLEQVIDRLEKMITPALRAADHWNRSTLRAQMEFSLQELRNDSYSTVHVAPEPRRFTGADNEYRIDGYRQLRLSMICEFLCKQGCNDPAVVFITDGTAWETALEMCELLGVETALAPRPPS